MLGYYAMF